MAVNLEQELQQAKAEIERLRAFMEFLVEEAEHYIVTLHDIELETDDE